MLENACLAGNNYVDFVCRPCVGALKWRGSKLGLPNYQKLDDTSKKKKCNIVCEIFLVGNVAMIITML